MENRFIVRNVVRKHCKKAPRRPLGDKQVSGVGKPKGLDALGLAEGTCGQEFENYASGSLEGVDRKRLPPLGP